jgi:hypothetical protein
LAETVAEFVVVEVEAFGADAESALPGGIAPAPNTAD